MSMQKTDNTEIIPVDKPAYSDKLIKQVSQFISLGYRNTDIAKIIGVAPETVSRIKAYIIRADLTTLKKVKLASDVYEKALKSDNLADALPVAHKVFEAVDKRIYQQGCQQANVSINVFDPSAFKMDAPLRPGSSETGTGTDKGRDTTVVDAVVIECEDEEGGV